MWRVGPILVGQLRSCILCGAAKKKINAKKWGEGGGSMRSEARERGRVKSLSPPGILGVGWGSPELWGQRAVSPGGPSSMQKQMS